MSFFKAMKVAWVVPELRGGIQTYSAALWPEVRQALEAGEHSWVDPVYVDSQSLSRVFARLRDAKPDVIHIQHEYRLFGRNLPGFYKFPRWLRRLRINFPRAKIVATAHSVLGPDFRYPTAIPGVKGAAAFVANHVALPLMRGMWGPGTWGRLDGVIVHSKYQEDVVRAAGCSLVEEIPHFVPVGARPRLSGKVGWGHRRSPFVRLPDGVPVVVVFGFISAEKGQDIAIRAFARMKTKAILCVAGDVRRSEDQAFFDRCRRIVSATYLHDRVIFTGFVPDDQIDAIYEMATLVLVPFRSTSGSGSLAHAIARAKPILASDLLLNREIAAREPGALEFFRSCDVDDCAAQLDRLIADSAVCAQLSEAAGRYAQAHTPTEIARRHLEFYKK
jgi:glycosyltransferase involved in cell wall biosynthesis